jgi:hypothetical protein
MPAPARLRATVNPGTSVPVEVGPRTVVIRFGIPANSFRMGCGGGGGERERERERSFIDNQECLKVGKHNALSGDTASDTHTFTHTHTHT